MVPDTTTTEVRGYLNPRAGGHGLLGLTGFETSETLVLRDLGGIVAYGNRITLNGPCEALAERVRGALAEQDFVILTELDLRDAVYTKLGVEMPAQVVLGVCRAPLADAVLQAEPSLGLLMPMPVVIRAAAPDTTIVEAVNPALLVAITGDPALEPLVTDSNTRLAAALHSLQT